MDRLYYHKTQALYKIGDLILPGSWGRLILGTGPLHNRFYAEYLLERIRNVEFSDQPSRMEAAFAFEDSAFAHAFDRGLQEYVYAVEIATPDTPFHRGDMSWIEQLRAYRTFEGVEEVARRYWRGDERDPRQWEVVLSGSFRVRDRLTPIPDNGLTNPASPQSP